MPAGNFAFERIERIVNENIGEGGGEQEGFRFLAWWVQDPSALGRTPKANPAGRDIQRR